MHPIICQIGPLTIYSYGLMLAIAVAVTGWFIARDARKISVNPDTVYDLMFWVVLIGILGARLFYIGLNADYFLKEPLEAVMIWKGGLAWQGSLIAGAVTAVVYLKNKKIPLLSFLDIAAPYVALGHAIGRIGCLLNGCCFGKPAAWGLYFPVWHERLQPTQIYMSLGQLAIFLVLRSLQSGKKKDGEIVISYFLLTAVERFLVEFARADHVLYWGLSIFQYVCIGIFTAALIVRLRLSR